MLRQSYESTKAGLEEGVPHVAPDVEVEFPKRGGSGAYTSEGSVWCLFERQWEARIRFVGFACFNGGRGGGCVGGS